MSNFRMNLSFMFYGMTSPELQAMILSSTDWAVVLVVVSVIAIVSFTLNRLFQEYMSKTERTVMIKIDRNGKHRYEIKENTDSDRNMFWYKVVLIIIALGFLCIPLHSWLSKS
ncbi:hypothetical protein [Nonlabens sp.]|uniref:hypothetical protein n=1 Tax=Nonlabens sp. TaxID=1888209 RepID=UPI003F6988DA